MGSTLDINFSIPLLLVADYTWGFDIMNFQNYDKYKLKI